MASNKYYQRAYNISSTSIACMLSRKLIERKDTFRGSLMFAAKASR